MQKNRNVFRISGNMALRQNHQQTSELKYDRPSKNKFNLPFKQQLVIPTYKPKKQFEYKLPQYSLPPRKRNQKQATMQQKLQPLNPIIDKPIRQLKSQFKVPVNQKVILLQCKAGCGRTFSPQALPKHQKICKKVFQSKRRQYNAAKHRMIEPQSKFVKKIQTKKIIKPKEQKKIKKPNWKAQSQAFRAIVKAQRKGGKKSEVQNQKLRNLMQEANNYVKCDICGRKFNISAGERHIKFCKQKSKRLGSMKKGR